MTKNQKDKIDDLFYYSPINTEKTIQKEQKRKTKEREKRIKKQNSQKKAENQFDYDNEMVIKMTNKNKVNKNIKTNAYIESVEIKRKLPNKVQIQIEERKQEYNVEFLNGYAYINNQGYILQISEEKQALPTIQGISTPDEQIVEGNRLNSEDLEKLEVIIQIMNICKNYELDSKITNIDISTKDEYMH